MRKTIKFRRVSQKNNRIKVVILSTIFIFLTIFSYVKFKELLVEIREKRVVFYENEILKLEAEYKEKLENLRKEYDGKIREKRLQLAEARDSLEKIKD